MNRIYRYAIKDRATVCSGKTCVTVYDETAKTIQQIVLVTVLFVAVATIIKAVS